MERRDSPHSPTRSAWFRHGTGPRRSSSRSLALVRAGDLAGVVDGLLALPEG